MLTLTLNIMYNYLLAPCVFLICLISCSSKKEYKYAEETRIEDESGKIDYMGQFKLLKAANDSAAYLEAYRMYCISSKVKNSMLNSRGKVYMTLVRFMVFTESGNAITDIVFMDKEKRKKEIADQVSLMSDEQLMEDVSDDEKAILRVNRVKKFLPPPEK